MTEYLTIVYTINDPKAFEEIRKSLILSMENSYGKPFAITAASNDHEIYRLELIESAINEGMPELVDKIMSYVNIGDIKNINELIGE